MLQMEGYDDILKFRDELYEAVQKYKKKKSDKDIKEMVKILVEQGLQLSSKLKTDVLLSELIEANHTLPKNQRIEISSFLNTEFTSNLGLYLSKPLWDYIPRKAYTITNYKPLNYALDPHDKAIQKILINHASKDDLRPVMKGIYSDEKGFTVTDGHRLLHVSGKSKVDDGVYYFPSQQIKDFKTPENFALRKKFKDYKDFYKSHGKLDEANNYPKWKSIVPSRQFSLTHFATINIQLVSSIMKTIIDNKISSYETFGFVFKSLNSEGNPVMIGEHQKGLIGTNEIPLNGRLFLEILESFALMGNETVDIFGHSANKGFIIMPTGKIDDYYRDFESVDFALQMPIQKYGYTVLPELTFVGQDTVNVEITDSKPENVKPYSSVDMDVLNGLKKEVTKEPEKSPREEEVEEVVKISTERFEKPKYESNDIDYFQEKIESILDLIDLETDKEKIKYYEEKIESIEDLIELQVNTLDDTDEM